MHRAHHPAPQEDGQNDAALVGFAFGLISTARQTTPKNADDPAVPVDPTIKTLKDRQRIRCHQTCIWVTAPLPSATDPMLDPVLSGGAIPLVSMRRGFGELAALYPSCRTGGGKIRPTSTGRLCATTASRRTASHNALSIQNLITATMSRSCAPWLGDLMSLYCIIAPVEASDQIPPFHPSGRRERITLQPPRSTDAQRWSAARRDGHR
jgi:hypothetical protein